MSTREFLDALPGMAAAKASVLKLADPACGHAPSVLLYGPALGEQAELGHVLAGAWLCTNPGADGACGTCSSCLAWSHRRHGDLLRVEPQPPSRLIRLGAITPGSDGELSIQEFLRTYPIMGRCKVVLVLEAERMNADAANAFLKTLEEPPERARIILTARSPGALLPTILSRCLAVACALPVGAELEALRSGLGELGALLDGSVGRAEVLNKNAAGYRRILRLAERLRSAKPEMALLVSEELRAAADELEKEFETMRAAQAETLAALGLALRAEGGAAGRSLAVAEAHRRIVGNGGAGFVFDALATALCSTS
jgi:DNA polymerase-3 subunit delta'